MNILDLINSNNQTGASGSQAIGTINPLTGFIAGSTEDMQAQQTMAQNGTDGGATGSVGGGTVNPNAAAGDAQNQASALSVAPTASVAQANPTDLATLVNANPGAAAASANVNANLGNDHVDGSGNTNQQQLGTQTGNYSTAENTLAQSLGMTVQQFHQLVSNYTQNNAAGTTSNNQNTTGNTAATGSSTNNGVTSNTGTSNTGSIGSTVTNNAQQGTSTTGVNDTLGFGHQLQSLVPGAQHATDVSNQFLEDSLQNGNPHLQQQVAQATSQALSGPGMTGTGNAAQARTVGNAAAQVGINDFGQQLQAAQQLSGPNAMTTLASTANPYLGSTNTNIGSSVGNTGTSQNTTGTNSNAAITANSGTTANNTLSNQNTSGSTANNQTSTTSGTQGTTGGSTGSTANSSAGSTTAGGTAAGSNTQTALGNLPQSSSSGGGSYVCTAFVHLGKVKRNTVRKTVEWKIAQGDRLQMLGYSIFGPWLAKATLASRLVQRLMLPLCRAVLYDELRLVRGQGQLKLGAWALHSLFIGVSRLVGLCTKRKALETRDPIVMNLLKSEGLFFQIK